MEDIIEPLMKLGFYENDAKVYVTLLELKMGVDNAELVQKLLEKGVNVYHWDLTEEMPLGIYTSDSKNTLITIFGSLKTYMEHNIGFLVQGDAGYHKGFEFLIQWFFTSCKKGEEIIENLNV